MDKNEFWLIINDSKQRSGGDTETQIDLLLKSLDQLSPEEIIEFDRIFTEFYFLSYRWDLWAAAYIINGGCSDDCFDYFRSGLIVQGEEVFMKALKDPESLADVITVEDGEISVESEWATGIEEVLYIGRWAYKVKTGSEMPEKEKAVVEIGGVRWDEKQVEAMLPRLAKQCGYGGK